MPRSSRARREIAPGLRDPRVWARRFGGACKLGFLVLVACGVGAWLAGLGSGREGLLFWLTLGGGGVSVALAELREWFAWRLGPLGRMGLLGLVGLIDVVETLALLGLIVWAALF